MSELNIVELIETNPITKLNAIYQSKLIAKIKNAFTENEQQLFVASFYGYLNYNSKTDFVIDLDTIWEWVGFKHKCKAKVLLQKHFLPLLDYKILLNHADEQDDEGKKHGGHNKETFMLTIKTFKLFCLKACTKKADQIHDYYIKLEEMLQEILNEETNELRVQLHTHAITAQKDKETLRETTILEHFTNNVQCVYYGIIDNKSETNETLVKFGNSNFLRDRVESHKKTFTNFCLVNAFKVDNKLQIENAMKHHPLLKKNRRTIKVNDINQTELLVMDKMSSEELDKIIRDIIKNVEYSPENYTKLLEENARLKKENIKLIRKYVAKDVYQELEVDVDVDEEDDEIVYAVVDYDVKKTMRQPDGFFHINGKTYSILEGTRQQVWDEVAYKTSGLLTKDQLLINKHGKIVSKKKYYSSKEDNRLNRNR